MAKQRLRRGLSVLALSLVAGVGISGAAWFAVHMTLVGRAEDLRSRALNYARTFAATVPTQAEHGQLPDLEPLAKYAAAVGLLYLQVVAGSEVLLERTSLKEAEPLLAAPMDLPLPQVKLRSVGGQPLVDVTVSYSALPPYFGAPSRGAYAAGRLRLGLDASSLNWAATNTRALAAALAGIAWGGLLICAARWKRLRREGARPCPPPTTDRAACAWGRTMAAGDITLYLDENRFVVAGLSARLTPKQVRLVSVLMSSPGQIFSDRDIVAAAWPDSMYADSKDVKQCVYLTRRRLEQVGIPGDSIIVNVPGLGYRVDPAGSRRDAVRDS